MSSLGGRSREVLAQGGSTVFSIITQTSNCLCQKMLNMLLSLNFQSKHDSNIDRKAYFVKKMENKFTTIVSFHAPFDFAFRPCGFHPR